MTIPLHMIRFKSVWAVLLLSLWLPATNHCALEILHGLEFLSCCGDDTQSTHQKDDCDDDACQAVESGDYRTDELCIAVAAPMTGCQLYHFTPPPVGSDAVHYLHSQPDTVPMGLAKRWQFSSRSALPIRAPSSVS